MCGIQIKYNYYNLEVIFSSGPVMYGFRNMIGLYLLRICQLYYRLLCKQQG